jgi:hypothetical protein
MPYALCSMPYAMVMDEIDILFERRSAVGLRPRFQPVGLTGRWVEVYDPEGGLRSAVRGRPLG